MIKTTLSAVAEAVEGQTASGAIAVEGVSTDTRSIRAGNLFVPIVGERYNGHDYAGEALAQGAAAFLWQADQGVPPKGPCVIVEDTLTALQRLSSRYRDSLPVRIIGITGSNGKTSTKDMVAAVLATTFKVHKTQGNLNNHIGLPLTLLSLPADADVAVLEMGMSGRGEIELLTSIARPDAAVITNIGEAHLLQLGSRDEIARAKLEIRAGLRESGVFIVPGDEPLIERYLPESPGPRSHRLIRFGEKEHNDLRLHRIELTHENTRFQWQGSPLWYTIPMLGKHNALNALAAIAVGRAFGVSDDSIAIGLAGFQPSGMRIERVPGRNGSTLWNDAYNANPTSMRAALELLSSTRGFRRKIAVLGDMLELGPNERELHRELGRSVSPEGIDFVMTCGSLGRYIAEGAAERFEHQENVRSFETKEDAIRFLLELIETDDLVLVKASRGMKLETIIDALRAQP